MTRTSVTPVHPTDPGTATAAILEAVRTQAPLVQCLTNSVVTGFTANVLLALGASPAMVDIPVEADAFARIAGGVLINLGTPHAEQAQAMREAARAATTAGTPWVLDPVAIGALPVRTALAHELRSLRPAIIRGNASEIIALSGLGAGGRGTDSTASPEDALPAATLLASAGAVVAVSGPVDLITDGHRTVRVHSGDPLLTRITGGGCALGAVMAACAAVSTDTLAATVAATSLYTIAAERAAATCSGPGSFAVALLDELAALDADRITAHERLGEVR